MGSLGKIHDVVVTRLKVFEDERGLLKHMMTAEDPDFHGFGQVYCSTVFLRMVKGWHFHKKAYRSYIALSGVIRVALYDERENSPSKGVVQEIFMGPINHVRVTIPPGIWSGFQCYADAPGVLCDVVNMPYNPDDSKRCDPYDNHIPFDWTSNYNQAEVFRKAKGDQ